MALTRVWRNGVLENEDFPFEKVSDYLQQSDCVVWADLCLPDRDDLQHIAEELGLNPLAVEDALESHERPKVDRYPTHLFVTRTRRVRPGDALQRRRSPPSCCPGPWSPSAAGLFDLAPVVRSWTTTRS